MLSQQLAAAASAAAVFGEHRDHPMRGQHTNDVDHNDPLFAKRRGAARSSGHRIRGIATPPARRDMLSEETPFVTVEDVDDVCQRCLGLPVMSEHTVGEVLGRVVSARRDARNRIVVDVDIEDTVEGWRTLTSVRDGKRLGFSLGQRFGGTRNDKGELTSADHKLPVELSVTESPEFAEDAWITYVTPTSNEHKQLVRELTEPNEQLGEKSHPDERAVLEFVATASSSNMNRTVGDLNVATTPDGKTLELTETMASKANAAQQRAAYLANMREEERIRAQELVRAQREAQLQAADAERAAAAAAAAAAAQSAQSKATPEASGGSASIDAIQASIAKLTEVVQRQSTDAAMAAAAAAAQSMWMPASRNAHLMPVDSNITQRREQASTENLQSPKMDANSLASQVEELKAQLKQMQQQQQPTPAAPQAQASPVVDDKADTKSKPVADELASLKKLIASLVDDTTSKRKRPAADDEPAADDIAEPATKKAVGSDSLDEFLKLASAETDTAMETTADETSTLEDIRAVTTEMDTRRKHYIESRDKLVRDIERFKKTSSEMDEETRIKRAGVLEKRRAEFVEMSKAVKEWFASQMSKYSQNQDDVVKRAHADVVGVFKAKRGYLHDDDLNSMKTHLVTAAASSGRADTAKRTLTDLHNQLQNARREQESNKYATEKLSIQLGAKQTVLADDPQTSMAKQQPARPPSSVSLTPSAARSLEQTFFDVASSPSAFNPSNASLIATASSARLGCSNAGSTGSSSLVAAASSANGAPSVDSVRDTVVQVLSEYAQSVPQDGMWVQDRPDVSSIPEFGSNKIFKPTRSLNGLNNPQTPGQIYLYERLMEERRSNTGKGMPIATPHQFPLIPRQNFERKEFHMSGQNIGAIL